MTKLSADPDGFEGIRTATSHGCKTSVVAGDDAPGGFPPSNCCCAHDWPCFKDPVHPYDYSGDWDLEDEWNRRANMSSRRGERKHGGGAGHAA